jgi:phage terminase large subunit-like protein
LARPRLPRDVKARRGTLRPSRERAPKVRTDVPRTAPVVDRDFTAIAEAYVCDVIAGRIVAGQWTVKACRRFERMRRRASDPDCAFTWSPEHVQDVCSWISRLPHVEGRWDSETIRLEPWQVFVLAGAYGFRRKVDGRRLVSTVFFQTSRKSAKSTLVAGAALYHLAIEQEPGAQVVCAATTGSQARIVFSIAQRMIRRSQWLRDLGFTAWAHAITFGDTGGTMKPIHSKSSSQDGLNPSFISLDESHSQDFGLHDVLKSAMGARTDGVLWAPTTAGHSLTSVGFALRSTAMKILDGVVESDHTFAVLYELDPDDDWRDERTWIKAAPMIGVTPTVEYVRKYRDDAIATPGLEGEFQVKVCNRWLHSASSWLSIATWDKCADTTLTLDAFRGESVYVGVDTAERDDIAAVAVLAKRDDIVYVFATGYLPALVVQDRARTVPEYRRWVESGELVLTDGNFTDYNLIEADIRTLCAAFDVREIVIERYGAVAMAANLANDGLPARIESKNAKIFTPPSLELEGRIRAGKIRHAGTSFLRWQVSNCCVERRRDGSLLPTKEAAESPHKMDAVDAVLLALSAMLQAPAPQSYEPHIHILGETHV